MVDRGTVRAAGSPDDLQLSTDSCPLSDAPKSLHNVRGRRGRPRTLIAAAVLELRGAEVAVPTERERQILVLIRLREEEAGGAIPELGAIAEAVGASPRDARRACDALEARGFLTGLHSMGGDPSPGYMLTDRAKLWLYTTVDDAT